MIAARGEPAKLVRLLGALALAATIGACAPPEPPADMVLIPASVQKCPPPEGMVTNQRSIETERVSAFFADKYEVTNARFAEFVAATGYITDAERIGDSVVFIRDAGPKMEPIFEIVVGADWRHPEGPETSIDERMDHPVVNVSWNDAVAYAEWAGKRLPTRGEWFAMARAGQADDATYPFGDNLEEGGRHFANTWQGLFPIEDTGADGFVGSSPVGAFGEAPSGVCDLAGNVWEWTAEMTFGVPAGADPAFVPAQDMAITRGGSFLCREEAAAGYHACRGYRIGRAEAKPLIDGNNQVGFRCVQDVD